MADPQVRNLGVPSEYEIFQRNRQTLSQLIVRLIGAVDQLGIESRSKALALLRERLDSDRFKVMVLGEFKRGKSTFINALLGEEVLPSSAVPCTAVINEIKWGEEKRAVLHFRDPLPSPLPEHMPEEIREHVGGQGGGPVPPLEVSIQSLERYVAIPEPEKDQSDSVSESPYDKVEVFWPLDLCSNGIEIIDSPGLNENVTRARVAKEYVSNVDAILFVMSCSALGAESELRVIDNDLRGVGHEYLFFICNRFDEIRPGERARLQEFGRRKLKDRTELKDGVYFLSALQALEGRLQEDRERFAQSGMAELEAGLTRFLTHDRGKVKLLQPARELVYALDEARNRVLPTQRAMLDESLAALEGKLEQMRPRLADAERTRDQILASIQYHRKSLRSEVRLEFETFLRGIADELEGWVQGLDLENKVKLLSFKQREQIETVSDEICAKIADRFEAEVGEWKKATLEPLLQAKLKAMQETLEVQVADFCVRVDQARAVFFKPEMRLENDLKPVSAGERAAVVIGGFLLGNPGFIAHGLGGFGFRGLGVNLLAQVASVLFFMAVGVTNPIALAAALVGAGALATALRRGAINEQAKREIARALGEKFRAELTSASEKLAEEIHVETEVFVKSAEQGLNREILVLREQVDGVLQAKKAGEVQVQAKRRALGELEAELREIDALVKELIFGVAESR